MTQLFTNQAKRPFWVYRPDVSVKGLAIEHIYREIMCVVTGAHKIKERIEVLMMMGYNVMLIHGSGYAYELGTEKTKWTSTYFGKAGSLNYDTSSYDSSSEKRSPTNEFSYYIQICGQYTWLKDHNKQPLVAFVEITEKELLKRTRIAKLMKLSG